jgi:Yip1 domain
MRTRSPSAPVLARLLLALCLNLQLYQEVSTDRAASGQALLVVLLAGVANGLGLRARLGDAGISAGIGAGLLGWLLWTGVVLVVARAFGQRRQGRSLLRALGFADAPGILLALGGLPRVGAVVRGLAVVWLVAATAVATQAVFDVSRRRGAAIALTALLVYLALGALSAWLLGG